MQPESVLSFVRVKLQVPGFDWRKILKLRDLLLLMPLRKIHFACVLASIIFEHCQNLPLTVFPYMCDSMYVCMWYTDVGDCVCMHVCVCAHTVWECVCM